MPSRPYLKIMIRLPYLKLIEEDFREFPVIVLAGMDYNLIYFVSKFPGNGTADG